MDNLPSDYDVIVIGTGMTASIIGAALSRIGQNVLHLDSNNYYGDYFASFSLDAIETWQNHIENVNSVSESSAIIPLKPFTAVSCLNRTWYENPNWSKEKLIRESRKFNLDLSPKMMYSRGSLVELLISSNMGRYVEFRCVNRVLTYREDQLENVPCTRGDVFVSKVISPVQKRQLVKILTLIHDYPEDIPDDDENINKTFREFLKDNKLPEQLIHYILFGVALGQDSMSFAEGIRNCQKFIKSLGRFGSTPFIVPMYGCGELPQSFCRLCAVFGGTYCLNRPVEGLQIDENNKVVAVLSKGQQLRAKTIVLSSSLCPEKFQKKDENRPEIARGIFITDRQVFLTSIRSIFMESSENNSSPPASILNFPPNEMHRNPITIIEEGSSCHVSPQGLFVVHMTTKLENNETLEQVFDSPIKALLSVDNYQEEKPNLLWRIIWKFNSGVLAENEPDNLHICSSSPDLSLDYDLIIDEAEAVFKKICPNEEFIPRVPDPEEIILDEDVMKNDQLDSNEEINEESVKSETVSEPNKN